MIVSTSKHLKKQENAHMIQRIESFSQLGENWNGYRASSFSPEVLQRARSLVEDIVYKVKVFPTGRNSIQFEFDSIPGKYLEIEVFADHYAVLFEKGTAQEEYESVSRNSVLQKIAEYYARRISGNPVQSCNPVRNLIPSISSKESR